MMEVILVDKKRVPLLLILLALVWLSCSTLSYAAETVSNREGTVDLRILETTDLHADLVNYDYYQTKTDNRIGLKPQPSFMRQGMKSEIHYYLMMVTILRETLLANI